MQDLSARPLQFTSCQLDTTPEDLRNGDRLEDRKKRRSDDAGRNDAARRRVSADRSGPNPTILVRTPYNKSRDILIEEAETLARNGYSVVLQDIRGRFESDGDFIPQFMPVTFEAEDGYDSVEWAAAQPWSDGKVGTLGNSYNAWTQWRLAPTRPPHLVAMWASGMGPTHHDWEVGGVFRPGRALHWLTGTIGPDTQLRLDPPPVLRPSKSGNCTT